MTIFPVLRDWIQEFLDENQGMIATNIGHNMLIEQVNDVDKSHKIGEEERDDRRNNRGS